MDPETDVIVAQIGLILGQLRFTRRAMEDIERSIARYGGVAVSTALQAGTRFGEPPLLNGALKVYVVNINDLAPGAGGGGLLEALLGGAGRFVGGLLGGIAGGAIGSMVWIDRLATLAGTIERILDRLGLRGGASVTTRGENPISATAGPNLTEALPEIRRTVQALTGLFTAAASGPDAAGRALGQPPRTLAGQQWLDALATFSEVLQGMSLVVDGLTRLVVVLIGALATLVTRLDSIKLAIVDLLQFALRNVFLLRGVTLVTIYDTLSGIASLGASVLTIVGTTIQSILSGIFRVLGEIMTVAVDGIAFLSNGIQRTIDALLQWIVRGVGAVLIFLGDTRIFALLAHVIRALPALLPLLIQFRYGTDARLTKEESQALKAAAGPLAAPLTPGAGQVPIAPFPNLAGSLTPLPDLTRLLNVVAEASTKITQDVGGVFRSTTSALGQIGTLLNESATSGEANFRRGLQTHTEVVTRRADELANALGAAQRAAAAGGPLTGMESIARAYESWLAGGGLATILDTINRSLLAGPTTGPAALRSLPGAVVSQAAGERPRATVEIQEVVIELAPAPTTTAEPSPPVHTSMIDEIIEELDELFQRGYRPGQGFAQAFA